MCCVQWQIYSCMAAVMRQLEGPASQVQQLFPSTGTSTGSSTGSSTSTSKQLTVEMRWQK
jgi:hypothetical protein